MVGRKKGVRQVKPSSHRRSRQLDTPAGIALIKELQTLLLEVSEAEDLFYTNVAGICKRAISPGYVATRRARDNDKNFFGWRSLCDMHCNISGSFGMAWVRTVLQRWPHFRILSHVHVTPAMGGNLPEACRLLHNAVGLL